MPAKDLHQDPFDESTIVKLEIFQDYAQAWLPTFVMQSTPTLCIFDFFAGTGYDTNGIAGSPIRILEKIKEQIGNIFMKKVEVKLYLNEFEPKKGEQKKFESLKKSCLDYLEENKDVKRAIQIEFFNKDFEILFPELLPLINEHPSLVYLDQNGIKFLSDKYLTELEKAKQTDFLYFVSSSFFWRFGNREEFTQYLDIDMDEAKKDPYDFIHRNIIKQLREKLPANTKLKLYPFSLKKGANIYGIIFGASHPRAVQKFLDIAWKKNIINGEANFDIDDDEGKKQADLFLGKKSTKIEAFKENVRNKILTKEIVNNFQALDYAFEQGHIGKHVADVIQEMKKNGEVMFEGRSPLVTYENVYKVKRKLEYSIIKK